MPTKKESTWMPKLFSFLSNLIDNVVEHSGFEVGKLRKKVIHYVFIYGLFVIAVLFLLIGLVKYLAEIYVFASEGIGFLIVGSVLIVILAAYSLLVRI